MKIFKLNKMTKGWFVGDFTPTAFRTKDAEVAVKFYKKDDFEAAHFHKIATELTLIIKGRVLINKSEFKKGDIILIERGESAEFRALQDSITCVVKMPSAKNDKFLSTNLSENLSENFKQNSTLNFDEFSSKFQPQISRKINVVIPMAGLGSRFAKALFTKPKPFIKVLGVPMIECVLRNLSFKNVSNLSENHSQKFSQNFILIAQKTHLETEKDLINKIKHEFNAKFIALENLTLGTACSVLAAFEFIDNDAPLLIANSDQIVDIDVADFVRACFERDLDGLIMVFKDEMRDKKWSFVALNEQNLVCKVREKEAISEFASVGLYFFMRGRDFVRAATAMIVANERVNDEFYTAPCYNYAIKFGAKIGIYEIAKSKMHGLGTPQDLNLYEKQKREIQNKKSKNLSKNKQK